MGSSCLSIRDWLLLLEGEEFIEQVFFSFVASYKLQLRVNFCYVFQVNSSYDQGSWLPEEEFEMSESFPVAKVKFLTLMKA